LEQQHLGETNPVLDNTRSDLSEEDRRRLGMDLLKRLTVRSTVSGSADAGREGAQGGEGGDKFTIFNTLGAPRIGGHVELEDERWDLWARRKLVDWLRPLAPTNMDRNTVQYTVEHECSPPLCWIPIHDRTCPDAGSYATPEENIFLSERTIVTETKYRWGLGFAIRNVVADWIEPVGNPTLDAVVSAVARCEIEASVPTYAKGDEPDRKLGEINTPHIEVETTRRRRRRRRGIRVPIFAGEVAARIKMRLGSLPRTPENEALVRTDAYRIVEGNHKLELLGFEHLRYSDMQNITDWAARLFWLETVAEEDIREYNSSARIPKRNNRPVRPLAVNLA